MDNLTFKAYRVTEDESGKFHRSLTNRTLQDLPDGQVTIKIHYAALNYKDALSFSGNKGVTRKYPHTPGIDGSGTVVESQSNDLNVGDRVIVTSYDLGMNTDGAFAEYIRVPASWVVPLPKDLSLLESMIIGTAGLTAGIGLYKMEKMGQKPEQGPIVISGATGGVGSMAIGILAKAGYQVIASSGKPEMADYLRGLGAHQIVDREFINDDSNRPLMKPGWAGAIDTIGGNTLATLVKGCQSEGNVAACGLVSSPVLPTTVFPFILNGVNLIGIDSATYPREDRLYVWEKLASDWRIQDLESLSTICSLEALDPYIDAMLKGDSKGRVVVRMNV